MTTITRSEKSDSKTGGLRCMCDLHSIYGSGTAQMVSPHMNPSKGYMWGRPHVWSLFQGTIQWCGWGTM